MAEKAYLLLVFGKEAVIPLDFLVSILHKRLYRPPAAA
jgi:hypothetical protein